MGKFEMMVTDVMDYERFMAQLSDRNEAQSTSRETELQTKQH